MSINTQSTNTNHLPKFIRALPWGGILFTLLGVLGYIVFFTQYDRAFPQSALNLALSRDEIAVRAREFMAQEGYDLSGYEFAISFSARNTYYLENTLGIPVMNQLIRQEDLPIWHWWVRWFVPEQEEEYNLYLSTDGRVVGFEHILPEAVLFPPLSQAEAQGLAEDYLSQTIGWNLGNWSLVSASSETLIGGRVDHAFEWGRNDFQAGESKLRVSVDIAGDQVSFYDYWLQTPEAFWREFTKNRNLAELVYTSTMLIGMGGFLAAGMVLGSNFSNRRYLKRPQIILPTILAGVISLASSLNLLSVLKINYVTTEPYVFFWGMRYLVAVFLGVFEFFYVLVLFAVAVSLNKIVWPTRDVILSRETSSWVGLARSHWRGLSLAGIQVAYVVAFYYLATQILGTWTPQSAEYSNLFATPFPFFSPLRIGILAALTEELTFRLIGIALILWLTRQRWLAVLIPALLWSFAHLSYVREPFYMRGIELLAVGVLYGIIFLKYDLTTVISSHFTFNALLGAVPMLRSSEPYFVISGWIVIAVIVAPLLPGAVILLFKPKEARSKPSPLIRRAGSEDRSALEGLLGDHPDALGQLDSPAAVAVCLEQDGKLVGAAIGSVEGGKGRFHLVYVAPEWRHRFWGTQLSSRLSETLKENGALEVTASVEHEDDASSDFLSAQGWRVTRRIFNSREIPTPRSVYEEVKRKMAKLWKE